MTARRLTTAVFALIALFLTACNAEKPSFKIGYMICNSLEETKARFDPLTAYLSAETGADFTPVYLDTDEIEDAFAKGAFEFTHTNSLLYVALNKRHGVKLLASEKRGSFGALTKGTIIVRKDSPINSIADLKDKRLVFGPQWAPYGFLAQYALMTEAGYDPEKHLGPYGFPPGTWKHEKIIYSVLYGAYDAGAAPLIDLEEMTAQGKVQPGDFKVIASSELGPYCTFGVSPKVGEDWAGKVRAALLKIDDKTLAKFGGEEFRVAKRAEVTGFELLSDSSFDIIRKWAKETKMPPYEEHQ